MKVLILAFGLMILLSCGSSAENNSAEKLDGDYDLIAIQGEDISSEGLVFTFNSEESRVSGETGCNGFSANYEQDGSTISFNSAISTKMFCEGKMDLEAAIITTLPNVAHFEQEGNEFLFYSEENDLLFTLIGS